MQNLGKVNAAQIMSHLKGLSFPCSKQDIINKAREMGAPQQEMDMLQKLMDKQFNGPQEIMQEVGKLI